MANHTELSGAYTDPVGYIQATEPTGVTTSGRCWIDTSVSPYAMKIFNGTTWITVGVMSASTGIQVKLVTEGTQVVEYWSKDNGTNWSEVRRVNIP